MIIDIVLDTDDGQFQFSCNVATEFLDNKLILTAGDKLNVIPLTSIEDITNYLPVSIPQKPLEAITIDSSYILGLEAEVWMRTFNTSFNGLLKMSGQRNIEVTASECASKALCEFRKQFNIEEDTND